MASPRSIILFTFLLATLELARGVKPLMCKRKEDCNGILQCIELEGERLECENGRCICINERFIAAAAAAGVVTMCTRDDECELVVRCITDHAKARCSDGKCRCML